MRCNAAIPIDEEGRANTYCTLPRGHKGLHGEQITIPKGVSKRTTNASIPKLSVQETANPTAPQLREKELPLLVSPCQYMDGNGHICALNYGHKGEHKTT